MAEQKISEMDAATVLTGAELVPIVQGGVNKTTTVSSLIGTGLPVSKYAGVVTIVAGEGSLVIEDVPTTPFCITMFDSDGVPVDPNVIQKKEIIGGQLVLNTYNGGDELVDVEINILY